MVFLNLIFLYFQLFNLTLQLRVFEEEIFELLDSKVLLGILFLFLHFEVVLIKNAQKLNCTVNKCGEYKIGQSTVTITEFTKKPSKINTDNKIIYADLSDFDFNFELRTRQDGDVIQPFGMTGHQKLKKYLNSKKIPNHEKDKLIMLAQGNEILWICAYGTSEKIRVKVNPTHKLEIKE